MNRDEVFDRASQRISALPDSRLKDALKDSLIGMRLIAEVLETLPADDPFIVRCVAIACRITGGPPAIEIDEVVAELKECIEIARSKVV